jgi:hypothetical protein
MHPDHKSLLVRADFVLRNRSGADRLACKRWRRLLGDVLPKLMGYGQRCPKAVVRLHEGDGEANYTGWLRISIKRRPGRKRLRRFKSKLRGRLEAGLLLIDGQVLKLGVRRRATRLDRPMILAAPDANGIAPDQLALFDLLSPREEERTVESCAASAEGAAL